MLDAPENHDLVGDINNNSASSLGLMVPQSSNTKQAEPVSYPHVNPLVVIQASDTWKALDFRSLWVYRELLYFLSLRDIKVRYKQTLLGVTWVVLQPLLMTLVFTVFLGHFAHIPSGGRPYALIVYSGLLPWTFFSSAVITSGNSLVGNAHLITKVYFPRMIIPIAAVAARFLDMAVAFLLYLGLMVFYRVTFSWNLLMLPVLLLLLTILALSIAMLTSALNVRYRDVGVAIPVLIQLLMFASPIVYPLEIVPQKWLNLYALNPLVGIIDGFRVSLLGGQFHWAALGLAAAESFVAFVVCAFIFRGMERQFADII